MTISTNYTNLKSADIYKSNFKKDVKIKAKADDWSSSIIGKQPKAKVTSKVPTQNTQIIKPQKSNNILF